ncbi:AAA family ATPase [Micromonospora sp. URMC 105]|uniref:AAA family ATPase n=1 Tax=Micromonospora sp. URMC 105 TaxID=3423413 RepID=UPI003F1B617D
MKQAADALAAIKLGRDAGSVIRWLAAKWAGARVNEDPAELTTTTAVQFCDAFFAVPGSEPYRWYDPFQATWNATAGNGGWPIGTVWTQLNRPSAKLAALLNMDLGKNAKGEKTLFVEPRRRTYLTALQKLVPHNKRIPPLEMAIWRYRFGAPSGVENGEDLVAALADELHLSENERSLVFDELPLLIDDDPELGEDWPPAALSELIPAPKIPPPIAVPALEPPRDEPESEEDDYRHLDSYAALPLESADVDALIGRVEAAVQARGLLLPDPYLVEQCVLALLTGHLVLQGPPGTGKTTLARALAEAFDCTSELQTATADWSTYDVIGGLQPGVGDGDQEILRPWLGHVPRAALRCARTVRAHEQDSADEPNQAHWLIIDEFSRAQIDKAIGGLYTVLGGSGEQSLELWFESDPGRKVVTFPRRFRIIATMNDVDASFVYDFSQGLSRRFQFVYVGVPHQEDLGPEVDAALGHAATWMAAEYPEQAGTRDDMALLGDWRANSHMQSVLGLLQNVIARVRYPSAGARGGGWPLGTAQVADVLRRIVLRVNAAADLMQVLDSALADRVVPQMSGAKPVVLQGLIDWLHAEHSVDLPRTIRAAEHLRDTSATA